MSKTTEIPEPVTTGTNLSSDQHQMLTEELTGKIAAYLPEMEIVFDREVEALEHLIAQTKPIMRLIDRPILESQWYYIGRSGGSDEKDEELGRGIVLRNPDWGTSCEDGGRYDYLGSRLLLMRDGTLVLQTREGGGTRWQGEDGGWDSETKTITPREAMEWGWNANDTPGGSTPLEKYAGRVRQAMKNAMDASKGKIGQLGRRKAVLDQILGD